MLHNPNAGGEGGSSDGSVRTLERAGHDVVYREADEKVLAGIGREDFDLVVIAGGDGTVADVLRAVEDLAPPITILPAGTANNVAYALGIEGPIPMLLRGLADGRRSSLRFGRAGGVGGRTQRFFESVGLGTLAHALQPVNQRQVPSDQKIPQGLKALRRSLVEAPRCDVALNLDGVETEERLIWLEVANIPRIGPQLLLAPTADPAAGSFRVATAETDDRDELLDWLDNHPDRNPAPIRIRSARRIDIRWRNAQWHLDDFFHDARSEPQSLHIDFDSFTVRVIIPKRPES
ncbi:MAG: diacylglycerol kinase family protein [Lautropia sp.]